MSRVCNWEWKPEEELSAPKCGHRDPTAIRAFSQWQLRGYVTLLLLLWSRFSRVRLCTTPQMAAHQAPPSLGFSRQEHWSGLPFPSPVHDKWKVKVKVAQWCPTPVRLTPKVWDTGILSPTWPRESLQLLIVFQCISSSKSSPQTLPRIPPGLEAQRSRFWSFPVSLKEGKCHHGKWASPSRTGSPLGIGLVDETAEFTVCSPLEILLGLHAGRTMAKRTTACLFLTCPRGLQTHSHPVSAGNLVLRPFFKI